MSRFLTTKRNLLPLSIRIISSNIDSRSQPSFFKKRNFSSNIPNVSLLEPFIESKIVSLQDFPLKRTALVYIHHALFSSIPVLQAQIMLGLDPKNMFILDKHYSRCEAVIQEVKKLGVHYQPGSNQIGLGKFSHSFISDINSLWNNVLRKLSKDVENLIIMDHGGHALAFVPSEILNRYNVIGIEKTTGGLINTNTQGLPFPIIEMASCATKKYLESPFIAEAVISKLTPLIPIKEQNLTCGVVGYGAIGKAIASKLLSMGHKVMIYDYDPNQLKVTKGAIPTTELGTLLAFSDYIFGCTGRDITANSEVFKLCPRNKTLISCSSEDIEFRSLLIQVQKKQNGKVAAKPLNEVIYQTEMGAEIKMPKGGFPANFDDSGESVPFSKILLTRSLVVAGSIEAIEFFKNKKIMNSGGNYMLDPKLQRIAVNHWLKSQLGEQFSKELLTNFQNETWIREHSGGIYEPLEFDQTAALRASL